MTTVKKISQETKDGKSRFLDILSYLGLVAIVVLPTLMFFWTRKWRWVMPLRDLVIRH